jgi:hypothetical protein
MDWQTLIVFMIVVLCGFWAGGHIYRSLTGGCCYRCVKMKRMAMQSSRISKKEEK